MQFDHLLRQLINRGNTMADAPEGLLKPTQLFVPVDATADRRKYQRPRARIPLIRVDGEMAIYSSFDDLSAPIAKLPLRLVMSDITPKGMGIFSEKKFYPGACISISLPLREPFYIKAKVAWCRETIQRNSLILSQHHFKYRIGLEFFFANDAEKKSVLDLIQKLTQPGFDFTQVYEPVHPSADAA